MQYDENAEKYGYEGEMTPMKCDELKAYKGDVYIPVYGSIADAEVYLKKDADTAIAELKDVIHELQVDLEGTKAATYVESVDAGMRERRLKRALWLARAERAKERKYKYETWERNELKKFNRDGDLIAIVSMKARKWRRVEIKCIKKAEEYK